MFDLNGKVAIVTGGANGIGFAYVKEFLKNGLKGVTIVDIDEAQGKLALETLTKEFGENRAIFVKTDVVDKQQIRNAFDKTIEAFKHFDILVNNAGILNESEWEKCMNINFIAVVTASKLAIDEYFPKYKIGEDAVILSTSSSAGFCAVDGLLSYSASKHGIVGFTRAHGPTSYEITKVKVVCICPHITDTRFRMLTSNEVPEFIFPTYKEAIGTLQCQSTEEVSKAVMKLIVEKPSGTVWYIGEGEIKDVMVPALEALQPTGK